MLETVITSFEDLSPFSDFATNVNKNNAGTVEELIKKFTVEVKGAVEKPGILTLGGSYNIEEIINIAGGFKEIANTSNISLLLPEKNEDGNLEFLQNIITFLMRKIL